MNRRHFFGTSLAAVAAAGLPAIVLPERTWFLPPRGGWLERPFVMREIRQYFIKNDTYPVRYDVAWNDGGRCAQFHVDFEPLPLNDFEVMREHYQGVARQLLQDLQHAKGFKNKNLIQLPLPRGVEARYV